MRYNKIAAGKFSSKTRQESLFSIQWVLMGNLMGNSMGITIITLNTVNTLNLN